MNARDASALIAPAIDGAGGPWADIGAGTGTFTRALVELLGQNSTVYAVDRDTGALAKLTHWASRSAPNVLPVEADFTQGVSLPGLRDQLDGMLIANALHFVPDAASVLARLVELVRPGGRVVLIEYDQRGPSRWVPYPISVSSLPALADAAALTEFRIVATRPSAYQGTLYCAAADRQA